MFDRFQNRLSIVVQRWVSFVFCSIWLSAFAFGIVPWISGKVAPELTREVHAQGIDASALFYTESEAVGEAFNYFQNGRFNF